jgi:hypothetical protein
MKDFSPFIRRSFDQDDPGERGDGLIAQGPELGPFDQDRRSRNRTNALDGPDQTLHAFACWTRFELCPDC